jgi:hypothetical protein
VAAGRAKSLSDLLIARCALLSSLTFLQQPAIRQQLRSLTLLLESESAVSLPDQALLLELPYLTHVDLCLEDCSVNLSALRDLVRSLSSMVVLSTLERIQISCWSTNFLLVWSREGGVSELEDHGQSAIVSEAAPPVGQSETLRWICAPAATASSETATPSGASLPPQPPSPPAVAAPRCEDIAPVPHKGDASVSQLIASFHRAADIGSSTASSNSLTRSLASSLFRDGLHSVYAFLTLKELSAAVRVSQYWLASGRSLRSLSLTYIRQSARDVSFRSLPVDRPSAPFLARHITTITHPPRSDCRHAALRPCRASSARSPTSPASRWSWERR